MAFSVGDNSPDLTGVVPANLTGATAQVHMRRPDGTSLSKTAVIAAFDAGSGTTSWSAAWADGDLSASGWWVIELEVTFAGDKVQTFGPSTMYVQPQIA